MKAEICVGIPASGKTTYAKKKCLEDSSWVNVNRDDLRFSISGSKGWMDYKFKKWRESLITEIQSSLVEEAYKAKKNVIISDTNLNSKTREKWKAFLTGLGYEVVIKEFPISLEEAWKRDAARPNGVGHSVIAEMYEKWLEYYKTAHPETKVVSLQPIKTPAIICDIDGTLAHMAGKRGPYDWEKVGLDEVDFVIATLLQILLKEKEVILISGRDGCCYDETVKWLKKYDIHYSCLFMRAPGDPRKDTIVKKELYENFVYPRYKVEFVIDDRPSVCRMWRELGLKVLQVGNPHIEF